MTLNRVINVDLHIHSAASAYKDKALVANSDIEHIETLFEHLQSKHVNLISITDHNRFDIELYKKARSIIASERYPEVLAILAGVEFDVKFEEDKDACHIISIFDVRDWDSEPNRIFEAISEDKLHEPQECYTSDRFERLLRKIGLKVILIAHQHEGITIPAKKKRSLTYSTSRAHEMLYFGYIDAVEYNNSRVQGILLNEFHELDIPVTAIVGSDCHEWSAYPAHDSKQAAKNPFCTRVKCLPSFEGLLMAFTSPETRFQVNDTKYLDGYITRCEINGHEVLFSPGINAIIGENGVGKSSLLDLLINQSPKDSWIKDFQQRNTVQTFSEVDQATEVVIRQGTLRTSFNDDKLFDDSYFDSVSHEAFEKQIRTYSESLKRLIKDNIRRQANSDTLKKTVIQLKPELEGNMHNIGVSTSDDFTEIENTHKPRLDNLNNILSLVKGELSSGYYENDEIDELKKAEGAISKLQEIIVHRHQKVLMEIQARNIIHLAIEGYRKICETHVTQVDSEKASYRKQKQAFTASIIECIQDIAKPRPNVASFRLEKNEGLSQRTSRGFAFAQTAKYKLCANVVQSFLEKIFIKEYQSLYALEAIRTMDETRKAVSGTREGKWEQRWDAQLNKFILEMEETEKTIQDQDSHEQMGNTFGQQSITYYKYKSFNSSDWRVMIVDQPEDDISHSRIHGDLIAYFDRLRDDHQIIMVTHNPLLVVNQDVDNVIVLNQENGHLNIVSGCLEHPGILDEIAKHMDGGKRAIEKRLKAYDANSVD